MTSIVTYEVMRETSGAVRVFAVMNTKFIETLSINDMNRLFSAVEDKYVLIGPEKTFAMVVDADKYENEITAAIDIVNDRGAAVDIRTQNIENHLGMGTDVNFTATSLKEVLEHVQGWLDSGVFAPSTDDKIEFPA